MKFPSIYTHLKSDNVTIEEREALRKQIMLYMLSLLGMAFLVIMSLLLYTEGEYLYTFLNLGFSALLVVLFLLVRTGRRLRLYSIVSISLLQLFFLYLFHSGAGDQMAFIWYYLYPMVSLFLLGIRTGTLLSLLLIGFSLLLNVFSDRIDIFMQVSTAKMFRILYSYLAVMLFAIVFERTRLATQERLMRTMEELNEQAIRDSLTGLYNRRYMDEVISRIVQQCRRTGGSVGFIMADIDYFKKYNDTYGHQAGDALLAAFAEMLLSMVRRSTDFVFRYGGEEFALIFTSISAVRIGEMVEDIILKTRELSIPHRNSSLRQVTVSAGAIHTESACTVEFDKLVSLADGALYEAKEAGRNRAVVKNLSE